MWLRRAALAALAAAALASGGCGSQASSLSHAEQRYTKALEAADAPPAVGFEQPVPAGFLRAPIAEYRHYAEGVAAGLAPEVQAVQAALARNDRSAAEAAWSVAFAHYLSLGAVYGEFGTLNQSIDGLPGGLPGGVDDPRFTGLHRLEYGLWTGQPLRRLEPVAARLRADVRQLTRVLPTVALPALDYVTRAHEILEDAERDFLSGTSVPWSGQGVLATQASLSATNVVFRTLGPLIGQPLHSNIAGRLAILGQVFSSIRKDHGGSLPTLGGLRPQEREQLDGATAGALQALQSIPVYLNTTPTRPTPKLPG
ncbi:MAG TPA: EfeM/EfeO family lipoprotein [Solirubrobacteraceae bacterium]|nr:EfeM/EfeO family lipoprotein [Solirubrobacteraceae bacterium]